MIIVNVAMRQDDIIKILEEKGYHFSKKMGMRLYFETPTDDLEAEAANAKAIIKASPWGAVVVFNTEVAK